MASTEVIEAWVTWESAPGSPWTAGKMEDAIQMWAAELGVRPTRLREDLTELRRSGQSIEDAVRLMALELSIEAES